MDLVPCCVHNSVFQINPLTDALYCLGDAMRVTLPIAPCANRPRHRGVDRLTSGLALKP